MNNKEKVAMQYYNDTLYDIMKKLGNGITDSIQLNKMGKKMFGNKYLGTFPSDLIPNEKNGYCVANLDNQYQSGSHWVAIVLTPPKMYVYDSFGRKTIKILPRYKNTNIIIKDADYDAEQNVKEENCGSRSLAWLNVWNKLGGNYAMLI